MNRPPGPPDQPRPAAIIAADHTAALAFAGPLAGWLLVALIALIPDARPVLTGEGGRGPGFLFIVILATIAGWGIAVWRVNAIRSIFSRGVPAVGQVCATRSARTLVMVDFRYTYHGRQHQCTADLLASDRARQICTGDTVALLVDPDRPSLALIRDLYL